MIWVQNGAKTSQVNITQVLLQSIDLGKTNVFVLMKSFEQFKSGSIPPELASQKHFLKKMNNIGQSSSTKQNNGKPADYIIDEHSWMSH